MIITCNKCSTSFTLDDSLVKEDGSKVRCTVCKDIFTVYPLPAELEPEPEELSDLSFESDQDDGDLFEEVSDFEMEDDNFSLEEDSDLAIESADFEMDDTLEMDDDLEINDDLEIDNDLSFKDSEFKFEENGEPQELELEETRLEFEDDDIDPGDAEEEDPNEIEFELIEDDKPIYLPGEDSEPDLEIDNETVEEIDEIPLETYPEPDKEPIDLILEEETLFSTLEEDFSQYDEMPEQETEPEDDLLEEETIEEENIQEEEIPIERPETVMDTTPISRKRKKKSPVGTLVLILLLLFFLVIGAYIASIMTGYKIPYISDIKIPFIEQYFKKSIPEVPEVKPAPNQKSVNGRFVTNSSAGTLFIITGRVENLSKIAYSHIEIEGALITKDKKKAKIKNAFCGNLLTEEMLKTGNISDINKRLAVKTGNHNSNVNVKPGASVPFMLVFTDLPEELQNFTVKVIKFEKAKNN